MQFQVPQFIEVEDKIFGPLTFRQFIYIGGGLGTSYIIFRLLPLFLAAPIILCLLGATAALAFFQFNGRPFIQAVENGFYYLLRTKLYLWSNERKPVAVLKAQLPRDKGQRGEVYVPRISDSKLHELAWSLDIKERVAAGIGDERDEPQREIADVVKAIRTPRDIMGARR